MIKTTHLINRRQFIQLIAAVSASWPLSGIAANNILGKKHDEIYKNLQEPWLTLAEVQEHLFPADENSPGAKDISALRFLPTFLWPSWT